MNTQLPASRLAWTAQHHEAAHSSPPQELLDNPGKTLLQTMDDAAVEAYIEYEVDSAREIYEAAKKGDVRSVRFLTYALMSLIRDLQYLYESNRIPEEFKGFDPTLEFAL